MNAGEILASRLAPHFRNLPLVSPAILKPIQDLRPILERPLAQITFFGAFKAGKSTLLNAVIGWPLLPSRTNRATGVITKVGYGSELAASLISQNKPPQSIFFDDLAAYILLDTTTGTSKAPVNVEAVEISLPLPLLKNRCILVDTPGLMDDATLTARTFTELEISDFCVMVLSADKLVSQIEKEAASRANNLLAGNIVFVVNRLDLVDEDDREEVLEWANTAFQNLGNPSVGQPRIFATEAKTTLEARKKGQATTVESGLAAFERYLVMLLDSDAGQKLIINARLRLLSRRLNDVTAKLESELEERLTRLLSAMQAEALIYLTKVEALLTDYATRNRPTQPVTFPEVATLRQTEQDYNQALTWCKDFQKAL